MKLALKYPNLCLQTLWVFLKNTFQVQCHLIREASPKICERLQRVSLYLSELSIVFENRPAESRTSATETSLQNNPFSPITLTQSVKVEFLH